MRLYSVSLPEFHIVFGEFGKLTFKAHIIDSAGAAGLICSQNAHIDSGISQQRDGSPNFRPETLIIAITAAGMEKDLSRFLGNPFYIQTLSPFASFAREVSTSCYLRCADSGYRVDAASVNWPSSTALNRNSWITSRGSIL